MRVFLAAPVEVSDGVDFPADRRAFPVRTCVGCRERAAKADLLRVVAVESVLVPDPRGWLPGRGAYLHPESGCLALAERRRALQRALRLAGAPDVSALREHFAEQTELIVRNGKRVE